MMLLRGALNSKRYRQAPPLAEETFWVPRVSAKFAAAPEPPDCQSESSRKHLHEGVGLLHKTGLLPSLL